MVFFVCDLSSVHDIKSFTSRFKGKDILVHVLHTRKSRNLEVTFLVSIITTGVNIDFYESNGLAFDFRLLFSIKGVVMETLLKKSRKLCGVLIHVELNPLVSSLSQTIAVELFPSKLSEEEL
ncbi:hypothetical protein L1987_45796 [Smallanthus sonchifolius]|uniref:Uncharacterized protein n=1 Tax=Smallanthus sonchifolius TaxID=185202 RepID=A0ACB9FZ20_9ASTR|nr:hypothetical protein L1987_45796 [Smallanthus sonchifolius]